jgi:radical SAM protein with 4Fe4S-binding SPASM domain
MCNIHEFYTEHPDMHDKEIDFSLLLNRLKRSKVLKTINHIDLTGGEPFLRKDLQQLVTGLFGLPAVDFVSINTNGFLTGKIASDVEGILASLKEHQRFSLSVSIDGIGTLHDTIRGVPGAFDKIEETVSVLKNLRDRYPQFSLRSNTVIQQANLHELDQVRDYWEKHGITGNFGVIQTPFYTRSNTHNINNDIREFSNQELAIIKSVVPKSRGMNHYIDNGCKRTLHCFAGHSALCIDPFGAVYPCNFLTGNEQYRIGDLKDKSIDEIWSSSQAWKVRKMTMKCPYTQCWNGCEVDQTLIQFDAIDRAVNILSCGLLSYYKLKDMRDFE